MISTIHVLTQVIAVSVGNSAIVGQAATTHALAMQIFLNPWQHLPLVILLAVGSAAIAIGLIYLAKTVYQKYHKL